MLPRYVLITPARNEAKFIVQTLRSVVAQTVRPIKWVIVSDGSTDGTDEIVEQYAAQHSWIELFRMPNRRERDFAGKAHCLNTAWSRVRDLDFDVVASLDADISFQEHYFAYLLQKLAEDPGLGLVGTPFRELSDETYDYRFVSIEHVSGACHVFRRQCFTEIGGYVALKGGGIDHFMVVSARMRGWRTRTFTDLFCVHHREMGTAQAGVLKARFKIGTKDYAFGNHPVWELFRTGYQMTKKPLVTGGLMVLAGYLWSMIRAVPRSAPAEMVAFQRREQMERLKRFLTRRPHPMSNTLAGSGSL
jgi:glycosyltransferase involved in cell wall biosynthesis